MELSIQKIKKEIESKRRHNEETLKLLKESSIVYNAEKEKQKKYFLNSSSSFLSKKRKHSNDNDDNNKNEEMSNDIINYEDYDDYIDDFNSSFFSNRTFTNLNFCRPERFSFSQNKNKKKLSIKNEEGFTIIKTIKPKPMNLSLHSNLSLTFSHASSKDQAKNNEIKNNSLGLLETSSNKTNLNSNQKSSFFDIKEEKKSENKGNSLFGDASLKINNSADNNNSNNNTKSLFSSNITGENKKEEKLFEKKENKLEQSTSLFGDLNRLNKNDEGKPLFSAPTVPSNSDKSKDNEKPKGLFASPIKENKNSNLNEIPKKFSLFGNKENDKEKEKEKEKETEQEKKETEKEKEKISIPRSLFGFTNNDNKDNKEDNKDINKEINNKNNNNNNNGTSSLFGFGQKTEEKKEETKEKISLFNIKPKETEEKKEQKEENDKPKVTGSLFGDILKKDEKTNNSSLFLFNSPSGGSLTPAPGPEIKKEEKKEITTQGLFSTSGQANNNKTTSSLFGAGFNKSNTENKSLFNNSNEKKKEEIKFDSNISKGSLATDSNPFLQQTKKSNIPVIFSANNLLNNNMSNNTQNIQNANNSNNNSLFNSSGNNNMFMNNNDKKASFGFGASSFMDSGNMEMSPESKSRSLNPINNNNPPTMNIFGAPINNNNSLNNNNNNSLFKSSNTNSLFGNMSTGGGGGLFSNQKSLFSGNIGNIQFSMGK